MFSILDTYIKSPEAPRLDSSREGIAFGPGVNTTVSVTPTIGRGAVLNRAAIEDANTTAGHWNELLVTEKMYVWFERCETY